MDDLLAEASVAKHLCKAPRKILLLALLPVLFSQLLSAVHLLLLNGHHAHREPPNMLGLMDPNLDATKVQVPTCFDSA